MYTVGMTQTTRHTTRADANKRPPGLGCRCAKHTCTTPSSFRATAHTSGAGIRRWCWRRRVATTLLTVRPATMAANFTFQEIGTHSSAASRAGCSHR